MTTLFAKGVFDGRTVLVTGGATGIGFAIAELLGSLGASIVIAARNVERLALASKKLQDAGIRSDWHRVNIRDDNEVRALFDVLAERGYSPDILVNNAGGQFSAPALDISPNGFRAGVDLNLAGTWNMSSAFAKHRIARSAGGRI